MIRLAVCDDDSSVIEHIEKYIDKAKDVAIKYEVFYSSKKFDKKSIKILAIKN